MLARQQNDTGKEALASTYPEQIQQPNHWLNAERWLTAWWPRRPALQFGLVLVFLAAGLVIGWRIHPGSGSGDDFEALKSEVRHLRNEVSLVSQASSVDRLSTIRNLRQLKRLPDPAVETLIRTVISDPSINVRLAAVEALAGHLDREAVRDGIRQSLYGQSSPMVQIALTEVPANDSDPQGHEAMRNLVSDDRIDPAVRAHLRKRLGRNL